MLCLIGECLQSHNMPGWGIPPGTWQSYSVNYLYEKDKTQMCLMNKHNCLENNYYILVFYFIHCNVKDRHRWVAIK